MFEDADGKSPQAAARTSVRQARRVEKSVGSRVEKSVDVGISYVRSSVSSSYKRKRREAEEKVNTEIDRLTDKWID